MYLMMGNHRVAQFDLTKGIYHELMPNLMPFRIRDALQPGDTLAHIQMNYDTVVDYLSSRVLDLDRENAKKLLNAYHFTQSQSPVAKARIAITCKAVSMTDTYWLQTEEDNINWDTIDPKHTSLSEIVTHIALSGSSLTLNGKPHTPELTGHGSYAKAWVREEDGAYLYKKPGNHGTESDIEVSVSKILDCFNIDHVGYENCEFDGEPMCKSKNMATDQLSIVTAEDVYVYCNRHERDFLQFALNLDQEAIYKMCVVDYLISNSDRHLQNWGFYMNNATGSLLCCHPLFDHNNAFDTKFIHDKTGGESLVFEGQSQQEAAQYSLKRCPFTSHAAVSRQAFINEEHYESFMERASELGLYQQRQFSFFERVSQNLGIKYFEKYQPKEIVSKTGSIVNERLELDNLKEESKEFHERAEQTFQQKIRELENTPQNSHLNEPRIEQNRETYIQEEPVTNDEPQKSNSEEGETQNIGVQSTDDYTLD